MARKRRGHQGGHGKGNPSTSRAGAPSTKTIDPARVAKQLKQTKTKASTTVVGICFIIITLCTQIDAMSKDAALSCIEEELTAVGKNAEPVLDFDSHTLTYRALARLSATWDTLEKAAIGLHRLLKDELADGNYADVHYDAAVDTYVFIALDVHDMGLKLTAEEVRQLFEVPVLSGRIRFFPR